MKKTKFLTVMISLMIFITVLGCSSTTNESVKNQSERKSNSAISDPSNTTEKRFFEKGEKIVYKLNSFLGHVGNQTIEVVDLVNIDGKKAYHLNSITTLTPEIQAQFSYEYEDKITSYIDCDTLLPIKIIKKVKQGDYVDYIEINLDQKNKTGVYISKKKFPDGKEFSWKCDGLLYLLSSIYYLRGQSLELNQSYDLNFLNEKTLTESRGVINSSEGNSYRGVPTISLIQDESTETVNSISMLLIDNKGKNYIPVKITIGVIKLGGMTVKLSADISSYVKGEQ